jgi:HlyD family secretion protein
MWKRRESLQEIEMKLFVIFALLVTLFLDGCDVFDNSSPQVLPTVALDSPAASSTALQAASTVSITTSGIVTASGNVVPALQVQLASALGGDVLEVNAREGEQVKAGQVLVRMSGSEKLTAAVESARMELLSAQQALKTLNDSANKARAAAQLRFANAQKALDEAEKRRTWRNYRNGSESQVETAQADVILANDALKKAEEQYTGFLDGSEDDVNRAAALSALASARKAHDKALGNLNYLLAMPNAVEVAQAEAELQSALAEVEAARKDYDGLKDGPNPDAQALADERVKNTTAQLKASLAALADLELEAPFDGTVARVNIHPGEWVIPGQPILILADLEHLRVETSDLSESDIPNVHIGQDATVFIKALNLDSAGRVSEISPLADTLGGDVVYKTIIDLDTIPPGLRAGMSVVVNFGANQ